MYQDEFGAVLWNHSLQARQKTEGIRFFHPPKKETGHLMTGFRNSVRFRDFYSQFNRYSAPLPLRKA